MHSVGRCTLEGGWRIDGLFVGRVLGLCGWACSLLYRQICELSSVTKLPVAMLIRRMYTSFRTHHSHTAVSPQHLPGTQEDLGIFTR